MATTARTAADAAEHARQAAEHANRAKMDFLAVMSHELRTPLNAIDGYAELMEMGIRGPVTAQQLDDLARIRRSERHLLSLVNDVLNFARLDAGRVEWRVEKVLLDEVLADAESVLLPGMTRLGIVYESAAAAPVLVMADREKLRQLLVNLLGNAHKFSDEGGAIRVEYVVEEDLVKVFVIDAGRGIPPDKLETIFEPFVQLDRHRMLESQQGVGLGLAISRELARGMGGELTASSAVGVGSTFVLSLPYAGSSRGSSLPDPEVPFSLSSAPS